MKILRQFIEALLRLFGIRRTKTPAPSPVPVNPTPSPPAPVHPAPTFHGFLWRHGDRVYRRELTWLQFTGHVHGCPPNETRYGFDDNGTGPYEYRVGVSYSPLVSLFTDVFRENGEPASDKWLSDWRLVWWPLGNPVSQSTAGQVMTRSMLTKMEAAQAPVPEVEPELPTVTTATLHVWVRNRYGSMGHWQVRVPVVDDSCQERTVDHG